jgi:hypothetical protein
MTYLVAQAILSVVQTQMGRGKAEMHRGGMPLSVIARITLSARSKVNQGLAILQLKDFLACAMSDRHLK